MTFDLTAARAKRRESTAEPFVYSAPDGEGKRRDWRIPSQKEWPIEVTDLLSQGKIKDAFVALTGKDGFPPGMTIGDVNDVMEAAAAFFGVGNLPNS